jgi:lysozyme family protein
MTYSIPSYDIRKKTYEKLWTTAMLDTKRIGQIDYAIGTIQNGRDEYRKIERLTGVPQHLIGIVHQMESSCNFRAHLFNGDPLTDRTKQVPKGLPKEGNPPFTWQESAIAAIKYNRLDRWQDWSIAGICYRLESYNGWGYFPTPIYSPYLWSFTNHYKSGKYVADGKYDPAAISGQPGAIAIVKRMCELGYLVFAPIWI